MKEFMDSCGGVPKQWLLKALSQNTEFINNGWIAKNVEVSAENIGQGNGFISDLHRLNVSIETSDKLLIKKRFVLKCPATDEARKTAELLMNYSTRESRVYNEFLSDLRQLAAERNVPENALPLILQCLLASAIEPVALVLEDLVEKGYEGVPFAKGFDYEQVKLALANLAAYHAGGMALRQQLPNDKNFMEKYPFLLKMQPDPKIIDSMIKPAFQLLIDHVGSLPGGSLLQNWLSTHIPTTEQLFELLEPREPFATVTHGDSSPINFLFCHDPVTGMLVSSRMIDFQVCMYSNPLMDAAFLIISSMEPEPRRKHERELVQYYLESLISALQCYGNLGLDIGYIKKAFWDDWPLSQKAAFWHLVMCGQNWFFGCYSTESTKARIVAVAKNFQMSSQQVIYM